MDEKEYQEKLSDEFVTRMKEEGCSSLNSYIRKRSYEQAVMDYERQLSNPYEY